MKQRVAGFVAALVVLAMLTVSACNGSGDTPEDGDVTGDGDDVDDIEIVEEAEEDGDMEPDQEPDVELESDGDTDPDGDADLADPDPDAETDIETTGETETDTETEIDTDTPPPPCYTNNDCDDGQFCRKSSGNCDAAGVCELLPSTCPDIAAPVCGCDMKTYENSCAAHAAGTNAFHLDACDANTACYYHEECDEGMFCKKDHHSCTGAGVCAVPPETCPDTWDPVCGCDGNNYPNECSANALGLNASSSGDCSIPNACTHDSDCNEGYFCAPEYDCEGLGNCQRISEAGSCGSPGPLDNPVCGCDGQTYESSCFPYEAGVGIWQYNKTCEEIVTSCTENADCDTGEYCWRETGACDGPGLCHVIPEHCAVSQLYNPVCGCDGNSYDNYCEAHLNAVNVQAMGPCISPVAGCADNSECGEGEYCHRETGACNDRGECLTMPTDCNSANDPVCGCDGNTYFNSCIAASEGMSITSTGECDLDNQCRHNSECAEGEYCAWDAGTCSAIGYCTPRKTVTDCVGVPPSLACGCNGATLENDCEASVIGTNIAHEGPCPHICNQNADCSEGSYCNRETGICDGPGECREMPISCPTGGTPVCGCDGTTYPNECFAQAAGMAILASGSCEGSCSENTDCETGEYCAKIPGQCEGQGFCEEIPPTCPDVHEPVCGCDGNTYGNACEAAVAGVNVSETGQCPATCTSNADCTDPETYCAKNNNDCDGQGLCTEKPMEWDCRDVPWEPVCGCDSNSYANTCTAQSQGVNIQRSGKCDSTGPCMYNSDCDSGTFCKKEDGCRRAGVCTAIPTECPSPGPDDAICSCDLVTYPSACHAWMNSQNVTYPHACGVTNGCFTSADCPEDHYCNLVSCEELGTCWAKPAPGSCSEWTPRTVCGCDGVTYENGCWPQQEGYSVLYQNGSCEELGTACNTNDDCAISEYCFRAGDACEGAGICHTRPAYCAQEFWKPVCGCDGNTYESYCAAHYAGVNVESHSNCRPEE